MPAVEVAAVERFRAVIAARLGLVFDEGRTPWLSEVLRSRTEESGREPAAYLSRLESPAGRDEWLALAGTLTVAETYFFRHGEQYRAFVECVLPRRMAARAGERRLRLLSLGCASGEEPYTLAMIVRDSVPMPLWDVSITAVDINPAVLEKATRGRYSKWALRETPGEARSAWFRPSGRDYQLHETIRAAVAFEQGNITDEALPLWQSRGYDAVFCRNVLMYFAPDQARAAVARIHDLLDEGGYLFMGHAETLRGLSNDFALHHTHGTFYYERRTAADRAGQLPPPAADAASLCEAAGATESWVDAIQRASARVAALTSPRVGPSRPLPPVRAWELGHVLDLLRQERFADALLLLDAMPAASRRDPDVLLLRAVLLAHGGRLAEAEAACRRLLEIDALSAGAQYLLAICREGAGDLAEAISHDQAAAYLDPGFAMPRLHLGLLARRAGDEATGRRELSQALALLQREEASRVLLFGGGFSREALMTLCRAELARCGGS